MLEALVIFHQKYIADNDLAWHHMPEIYIRTDVKTDGPIPGPHSMLSFGLAAYVACVV